MNMLHLNVEQQAHLSALNANGHAARQLQPLALTETLAGLNTDLLQDCGPGQTWDHYAGLLQALPMDEVDLPVAASL